MVWEKHVLGCLSLLLLVGCAGYSFQNSNHPAIEKAGIRRVYVAPVVNDTYQPGVENVVYNQLVKIIAAQRQVKIVASRTDADAIITGTVTNASLSSAAQSQATNLYPSLVIPALKGPQDRLVSTSYSAQLSCNFSLHKKQDAFGKTEKILWSGSFDRSKAFPANNQLDAFGTTSALINASELNRALSDLAESMMADLHESMFAMF